MAGRMRAAQTVVRFRKGRTVRASTQAEQRQDAPATLVAEHLPADRLREALVAVDACLHRSVALLSFRTESASTRINLRPCALCVDRPQSRCAKRMRHGRTGGLNGDQADVPKPLA